MGYGGKGYGYTQAGYGYGTSEFTGFDGLSIIPNTLGWWSVARRVLSRYNGPAIRLRRSSDSAEQDFYGIGPQGEVSTADVRAWNGWNLLARTEEFDNAYWTKAAATAITANSSIAPNGTLTADKIIPGNGETLGIASSPRIARSFTPVNTTYTASIYAKAAELNHVRIRMLDNVTFQQLRAVVSLVNGAVVSAPSDNAQWSNVAVSVTAESQGFYRVAITGTYTGATSITLEIAPQDSTITTGDGVSGIFIWGVQLERGSSATGYEPRTTTSAGDSFLVTLYDQSGLTRHFTQSTTTLQPIICEQGVPITENGRLAAKFVAADARRMSIASSTAMFNALHTTGGTVLCVSKANDTALAKAIFANKNSGTAAGIRVSRDNTERLGVEIGRLDVAGVATNGTSVDVAHTASSTSQTVVSIVLDPDNGTAASRSLAWQNGTAMGATNAQTGTPFVENSQGNMTLGASANGGDAYDGPISELALFSALISTADRTTWQSRSGVFYTVTIA